jgi:hypothetical protein
MTALPTALAFAGHGHAVFPINWPVPHPPPSLPTDLLVRSRPARHTLRVTGEASLRPSRAQRLALGEH